jgi:hypothetical protein
MTNKGIITSAQETIVAAGKSAAEGAKALAGEVANAAATAAATAKAATTAAAGAEHENRSGSITIGEHSSSTERWKDVPRGTMDEVSS